MTQPLRSGTGSEPAHVVRPWWILVGGLAVIGVGGALAGGAADEPESSSVATSTAPSTDESSAASSTTTSRPAPSTAATSPATTIPPTTTAVAIPSGVDFVMPDLVGLDLQSAQDAVQDLGVFYSVSHDLLGSRNQVLDSNWIVCDQNVAPGQRVTGDVEGQLDFGVVKREESCP
jgi:hypothetical protein